jgi:uncharacterized protein YkuJ
MINIPIVEEYTDEEDSFELEVMQDQKSAGKYKFKKSDMKSLLIGIVLTRSLWKQRGIFI